MGNCFNTFSIYKKEIITEKSLLAVKNVTEYLKDDIIQRDVFRATGHEAIALLIAKELHKGSPRLYQLLEESSVRDIATGLVYFLMCLKKPLIPPHIQAIVLDPDNMTICPEIVAQDALGLIKQEVVGRQMILLQYVLDLLNHVVKYTPTDELSGTNVPIYMMPVFFNLQTEHLPHWRRVATIFIELIRLAPQQLDITSSRDYMNNLQFQNVIEHDYYDHESYNFLQHRVEEMQLVVRRYLARAGNRGDSSCFEVYDRRRIASASLRNRHRRNRL